MNVATIGPYGCGQGWDLGGILAGRLWHGTLVSLKNAGNTMNEWYREETSYKTKTSNAHYSVT